MERKDATSLAYDEVRIFDMPALFTEWRVIRDSVPKGIALDLFLKNYNWEFPIRSIGVRGAGLIEATEADQLSLFLDDIQRQKRERIEGVVDSIRSRFGYMSVQRAAIFADPQLAGIRPKEHVVHPVGFFGR